MVAIIFRRALGPRQLSSISFRHIYYVNALMPVISLILVFAIGISHHPTLLFDYNWACGKAHLPSISRIINMPLERTVFQLLIYFTIPFSLLALWFQYHLVHPKQDDLLRRYIRYTMVISNTISLGALSLLAAVGEHESGNLHVVFFIIFTLSSFAYYLSHSLCLRIASDGSTQFEGGTRGRIAATSILAITVPLIFSFFTLYNGFCVPYTYELFALFEYITVGAMCFYHVTSFYQLRGRLILVHPHTKLKKVTL